MPRAAAPVVVDAAAKVAIPAGATTIAGRLWLPPTPRALYVLGHGAGAGMHHRFMVAIAGALAERAIATLRWEMPAMTAGRRLADRPAVVRPLARAACVHAAALAPGLPLVAGGKSMGGRMTSEAQAAAPIPGLRGLAFLGFPLHPAGAPAIARAAHLAAKSNCGCWNSAVWWTAASGRTGLSVTRYVGAAARPCSRFIQYVTRARAPPAV